MRMGEIEGENKRGTERREGEGHREEGVRKRAWESRRGCSHFKTHTIIPV